MKRKKPKSISNVKKRNKVCKNKKQEVEVNEESETLPTNVCMSYECYDIIKSPLDGKTYLAIQFENGLQCVLISSFGCNNDIDYCLPLEPTTCTFQEVYDFNKQFLQMYNEKDAQEMSIWEQISSFLWGSTSDKTRECKLEEKKLWKPPRKTSNIHCPNIDIEERYGVSVTIGAGCLSDPKDVSGLSHLLEHVVFLETKKFSDPWTVLTNHVISANAATEMDHTLFHATMSTTAEFLKVLELFSEMMIHPKLEPVQIANEVYNVDCENTIKLSRDFLRLGALFLLCCYPDHPMIRFGMGDMGSLGRCDIAQLIQKHYKRLYRANFMMLCMEAPIPMENLISLSASHFKDLQCSNDEKPWDQISCEGYPFNMEKFCRMYKLYPFKNVQWMTISWVMSSTSWQNFQCKPLDYVAMLLSHKGHSGLDRYLKDQGWITCCAASYSSECQEQDACFVSNKFYSGLHFGLEVTNEGIIHEDDIMKAVFSYISMLRKNGPKRWIFNELRTSRANKYHYRTCVDKAVIDIGISASRVRSPKFILTGPDLLTTYDPEAIKYVLDNMVPRKTNVMTVSRLFQNLVTSIDPVSLATYHSYPFSVELLRELERVTPYPEFELPPPNPYIRKNICRPLDLEIGGMNLESSLAYLRLSGKADLQHQHNSGIRGVADYSTYTFEFISPYCKANPHNCAMIFLWKRILQEKVLTRIHEAILADVAFSIYDGETGLLLALEGPAVFLPTVWLEVLDEFVNFESYLEEMSFLTYKELYLKIFQNANLKYDTLGYTEDLLLYITTNQYILMSVLENYLRYYVTFEEFVNFTTNFKSRMWICSQLSGTVTYSELGLVASSITRLVYEALPEGEICVNHVQELPLGEKCLSVKAMSNSCITATTWNYYQFGRLPEDLESMLPILAKHISNFLFNQLRTQEQLSYYVKVEADVSFGVSSISVILIAQADRFKPGYVDERIDNSLANFYCHHMNTEKQIQKLFKTSSNSSEAGKTLMESISDSKFIRRVQDLYRKCLPFKKQNSYNVVPSFRKLSVQVQGYPRYDQSVPLGPKYLCRKRKLYETPEKQIKPEDIDKTQGRVTLEIPDDLTHENAYFITSLEKFKQRLKLYPRGSD